MASVEEEDKRGVNPRDLFRFSVALPIRYGDIDAQRHLNNVAYFAFMEHGRVAYFQELGLWDGQDFDAVGIVVAEARCQYLAPAFLGETVRVWLRVSRLGGKSFHFDYLLETGRGTVATAQTVQVCYDYASQRSIQLSEDWRKKIVDYEVALQGG